MTSWQTKEALHSNEMLARLANMHASQGRRETATTLHKIWRSNEDKIRGSAMPPQKRVRYKRPPEPRRVRIIEETPNQKVMAALTRIASAFFTSPEAIIRGTKNRKTTMARYVCYYVLLHRFGYSLSRTGRMMKRHNSTVKRGLGRFAVRMEMDEGLRAKVNQLAGVEGT